MLYEVVRILVITLCCVAAGLSAMNVLQAQRYQIPILRRDLRRYADHFLRPNVIVAAAAALLNWYLPVLLAMAIQKEAQRVNLCAWLVLAMFAGATALVWLSKRRMQQKKPLAFTRRLCRLVIMTALLELLIALALDMLNLSPYLVFAGADYLVLLAAVIMRPVEERINKKYYNQARKKLAARKDLIRIGVTGSFGKTQVKLMLRTLLAEKYRVLSTPPSFSTAMGISRVVNDQLDARHQVLIAEMGAQHRGEIKEMARLVRPQYGVLTCVGDAHLDSFGSIEAAAQTKYELIQALPSNGKAFFGSDRSYGDRLFALCEAEKYRAGVGGADSGFYMRAEHIETGVHGTRFELSCADGGHVWTSTKLLGSFSVKNIALSAAVARQLGLSMEEIARGVEKLKPTRHRLQLRPGTINVIDNSLNTLPEGAAEALQVLKEFPGRRVLVTAGLTELETNADDKNYAFGLQIAGCADYVVLIGPEETRSVMRGLMSTGYPKSSVRMVSELSDAAALVQEIAGEGDSVLYEGVYPEEDDSEA